jgi:thiosulfate dehydrogenase [quinone] large subunit
VPRRNVLEVGVLGGTLAVGLAAIGLGTAPLRRQTSSPLAANPAPTPAPTPSPTATATATSTATPSAIPSHGQQIARVSDVPVGSVHRFTDPSSGELAYILQPATGRFIAMSATCTHQGCTVAWRSGSKSFRCPCHGAVYDANGNVVGGPAPAPLPRIDITVQNGVIYLAS